MTMDGNVFSLWMAGYMRNKTIETGLAYAEHQAEIDPEPEFWNTVIAWIKQYGGAYAT